MSKPNQTYYEILEIDPGSPEHEIHKAYQRAKQTYSSDNPALYTMFTQEEARELMILIEEAYATLSDQSRRKEYDQKLKGSSDSIDPEDTLTTPMSSKKTSHSEPLPQGFSRTRYGVYEVDPETEELIKNQTEFDGEFLKHIRDYKKIGLDLLSKETRISRTYLAAIEAHDYEALPAPVFVRGFVVQLAKQLGLNDQMVANSYMDIYKKSRSEA